MFAKLYLTGISALAQAGQRGAESNFEKYELIITLSLIFIPILLGLIVGRTIERRHFKSLAEREAALSHMLVTDVRPYLSSDGNKPGSQLFVGEAVIANDPLKSLFAKLRKIIGGNIRSYETLVERARREAILRVMEAAHAEGYNAVCCMRLETSDLGANATSVKKGRTPAIGMIACGTGYSATME